MFHAADKIVEQVSAKVEHQKVPLKDKRLVVEGCVAQCLAYMACLPTTRVYNPNQYFIANEKLELLKTLSRVNERLVVDIDRTMELTYKYWLMRYALVHTPGIMTNFRLSNALCDSNHASPQQKEVFSKYCTNISGYVIRDLMEDPDAGVAAFDEEETEQG